MIWLDNVGRDVPSTRSPVSQMLGIGRRSVEVNYTEAGTS